MRVCFAVCPKGAALAYAAEPWRCRHAFTAHLDGKLLAAASLSAWLLCCGAGRTRLRTTVATAGCGAVATAAAKVAAAAGGGGSGDSVVSGISGGSGAGGSGAGGSGAGGDVGGSAGAGAQAQARTAASPAAVLSGLDPLTSAFIQRQVALYAGAPMGPELAVLRAARAWHL